MISKKKLLEFLKKFYDENQWIQNVLPMDELEKYKDKLLKKFGELSHLIDVTQIDDTLLDLATNLGLVKIYNLGKKKFAKISKWAAKVIKELDETEFADFFNNIIKKFLK